MQIQFDPDKHKYFVDGEEKPSVTAILDLLTADHYGAINPAVLDTAKRRGAMVHEALEEIDYGCFDGLVPYEISGYIEAYQDFLRTYNVEWHGIERMVYEPILQYCGTVDRYGTIDGEWCVVDIKTYAQPTKANYLALMGQTAAYAIPLMAEGVMPKQYKTYGLFLRKDGTFRLVDCEDYAKKYGTYGMFIFSKCIEFYRWKERTLASGRKRNDGVGV